MTKLLDKRVTPFEPNHELVLHSVDEAVTLLSQEYQVEAVMPLGYIEGKTIKNYKNGEHI